MRPFVATTVVAAVLLAAGCGGGSSPHGNGEATKSADQVLADAVKATDSASSLRMTGDVSSTHGPIGIDYSIARGKGGEGSLTLGGDKAQLIVVGHDGYLKAGPGGWNQLAGTGGAMIAQRLRGRWLKFPVDNPQFQPIVGFTDPKALVHQQMEPTSDSVPTNAGVKTYKGMRVVEIRDAVHGGKLYVAADGPAYPVALVGSVGGTIAFDRWNQPVSPKAPTNVVDLSQLAG
ncbi:MAG TPA: hypothetical protein VGH79_12295 [Gaiellaceae bacterium]|jgi:hypothetical protein